MPFNTIPRQRRKSLGLFLILIVCMSTFAVLIRSNITFDLVKLPEIGQHTQVQQNQLHLEPNTETQDSEIIVDANDEEVIREKLQNLDQTLEVTTEISAPTTTSKPQNQWKPIPYHSSKLKYTLDRRDLEFSRNLRINKEEGCGMEDGFGVDLVVLVYSNVDRFEERSAIRDTWGGFSVERGGYLYFILGSPDATDEQNLQASIESEDAEFGDIIQLGSPDSAETLKSVAMLAWVKTYCTKVRYILKISDDAMVNMQKLVDFAETQIKHHQTIFGPLAKDWKPAKDPSNRYYLPRNVYTKLKLPYFVLSPVYLLTTDSVIPLLNALKSEKQVLAIEDVYITGVLADKAKLKRLHDSKFKYGEVEVNECNFANIWTATGFNSTEIRRIWDLVYEVKCETV